MAVWWLWAWAWSPAQAASQVATPVTVQLNWKHQFEYAAFYAAIAKGYYREAGLDVRLVEGGPGIHPVREVLAGSAQFGVSNASLIVDYQNHQPVVALAALMQQSAVSLLGDRLKGVQTVHDLAGKTIQCQPHLCDEVKAFLLAAHIDLSTVTFKPNSHVNALQRLQSADAVEIYASNDGFWVTDARDRYVQLFPSSLGITMYGDILFTTQTLRDEHPALVKAFRQATLKGLRYAFTHHAEMIQLIKAQYDSQGKTVAHLAYEADTLNQLIRLDWVEPGYMSTARWQDIRQTYARLGVVSNQLDLNGFVYNAAPSAEDLDELLRYLVLSCVGLVALFGVGLYVLSLNRRLASTNEQLNRVNQQLDALAHYDPLTQLPNRLLFSDRVQQTLKWAKRHHLKFALMVIDLDKFKPINDTHGHDVGDEVLKTVAQRLMATVRQTDTVARVGGDEFVVLLTALHVEKEAVHVAHKMRAAVSEAMHLHGVVLHVDISVGVAMFPDHGLNEQTLTKHADLAMYDAKAHHGGVKVFHPSMATAPAPVDGHAVSADERGAPCDEATSSRQPAGGRLKRIV